jgi:hypothetical protein
MPATRKQRVFKTAKFSKSASKAGISDQELCKAINEVLLGQADNLGGGVYKKRINDNMHRSIVLAKGGMYWIYEYLFAKKDRDNIDDAELDGFRKLAKAYASLTDAQVQQLVKDKDFLEICNANTT